MTYVQTTRQSWLSRLTNSVGGMFVGLALVLAAFALLFWNEGRAIKTARALAEGARLVLSVSADRIDPANEAKLVHISGSLAPQGEPTDNQFGMSAPGAIRLARKVEMYQWQEKRDSTTTTNVGGSQTTETKFSYERKWTEQAINSSSFQYSGHDNPPFPFSGQTFVIDSARLGGFAIEGNRLSGLGNLELVAPGQTALDAVSQLAGRRVRSQGGMVWTGDPQQPQIGDLRVSWSRAVVDTTSAIGRQTGDGLGGFRTSNGRELFFARIGKVPADAIFRQEATSNAILTWAIRLLGLFLMYMGFGLSLRIFRVAADIIPPLGRLVQFGLGMVAMLSTLILGSLAIGLGWLFYRPLLGAAILAIGLGAAWLLPRLAGVRTKTATSG